jgi:tripeptide aminopeptidase
MIEQPVDTILDRFVRYAKTDTQANEHCTTIRALKVEGSARLLLEEAKRSSSRCLDGEWGIVLATIPGNTLAPTTAWVAHVDTSPEYSGTNVKPLIHRNYAGGDIPLPGDTTKVIRVAENPDLKKLIGGTIITSDGSTLLGADDKAGSWPSTAAHPHGPSGNQARADQACFTCDEEICHGGQA